MISPMPDLLPDYEKAIDQMKIGDVIAFSGNAFLHKLVRVGTRSKYSHLALVDSPRISGDVLIVESHIDTRIADAKTGEFFRGVQTQWLSKRLEFFNGSAWWVPLKNPPSKEAILTLKQWLMETHNKRVRYDFIGAIGAGIDFIDRFGVRNSPNLSSLFCSELVAAGLQVAGVLDSSINPSEQTPAEVMRFDCFANPILIKGKTPLH